MKYALVVVEKPTKHTETMQGGWPAFLRESCTYVDKYEASKRLSENCFLFALESDSGTLAAVVSLAQNCNLSH